MTKQKKTEGRTTSKKDKPSTVKGKTRTDSDKQVQLIDKELVGVVIDSFNLVMKTFDVGGKLLTLEAGDVGGVYGLPTEGRVVNPHSCGTKDLSKLESEINIIFVGMERFLNTQDIYATWGDTTDPVAYAKMYILIALGELLATGNSFRVNTRYAHYLAGSFASISEYNWAQHVVDIIISGLVKLKTSMIATYPEGDMNLILACDIILFPIFWRRCALKSHYKNPACSFWHDGNITTTLQEIRNDDQTFRMRIRSRDELQTSLTKKQFYDAT
ncbi:hypothetical protein LINPERPRIM_LOCUS28075, partial [Linum perenne]